MARMQTVPPVHSASGLAAEAPHFTSAENEACENKDIDATAATESKTLVNITLLHSDVMDIPMGWVAHGTGHNALWIMDRQGEVLQDLRKIKTAR
jgi:hypothetical protein